MLIMLIICNKWHLFSKPQPFFTRGTWAFTKESGLLLLFGFSYGICSLLKGKSNLRLLLMKPKSEK